MISVNLGPVRSFSLACLAGKMQEANREILYHILRGDITGFHGDVLQSLTLASNSWQSLSSSERGGGGGGGGILIFYNIF